MKYLEFEGRELEGDPYTGLLEAIGATSTLSALLDELVGKVCDENFEASLEFVTGFVKGALAVWLKVKDNVRT